MNRAQLACAAAALACGAAAQAEVTLYGKVDLGVVHESGGSDGAVTRLSSGAMSPSRLGVKADFDLGDGLKAKAQLETGFCADSRNNDAPYCTGGNFMGRRATLALAGAFGEVSAGRQFVPAYLNIDNFDPFGTGTAGQATNLFDDAGLRANNSIVYTTPSFGGFSASALYAFGEVNGSSSAGRKLGGSAGYAEGPLAVGAAYQEDRSSDDSITTKHANIGASYDFKVATLNALYQRTTGKKSRYLIGTTVPAAGGTVMASYIRLTDGSAAKQDASQVGIGYTRPIAKQLKWYAAYAHISNKNGAGYTVGNATDSGSGDSAFNLGLVLSF